MYVAAGQQHEYGAYYRGTHYGQPFTAEQAKTRHYAHAGGYEEETEVVDKEL